MSWVELTRLPTRRRADEVSFILRGGGVPSSVMAVRAATNGSGLAYAVLVAEERLANARQILDEEGLATPGASEPMPAPTEISAIRRPGLHWVVGLVLVNLLIWIAMEGQGGSEDHEVLLRFGASHAPALLQGQLWRTVTAIFIHIGLRHLLANMVTLSVLGVPVLRGWGVGRFYFMYLLAGLAGNWLSFGISPTAAVKAGASGSILGLLGVLAGTRIRSIRSPAAPPTRFKTWHILAMLVAFYGFVIGVGGRVDHLAHIGGLVMGALLALLLPPPGRLAPRRELVLEVSLGGGALLITAVAGLLAYVTG